MTDSQSRIRTRSLTRAFSSGRANKENKNISENAFLTKQCIPAKSSVNSTKEATTPITSKDTKLEVTSRTIIDIENTANHSTSYKNGEFMKSDNSIKSTLIVTQEEVKILARENLK